MKVDQYATAGIALYWRVEQAATSVPLTYTSVLDPRPGHRDAGLFAGVITVAAPFPVEVDLGRI